MSDGGWGSRQLMEQVLVRPRPSARQPIPFTHLRKETLSPCMDGETKFRNLARVTQVPVSGPGPLLNPEGHLCASRNAAVVDSGTVAGQGTVLAWSGLQAEN